MKSVNPKKKKSPRYMAKLRMVRLSIAVLILTMSYPCTGDRGYVPVSPMQFSPGGRKYLTVKSLDSVS